MTKQLSRMRRARRASALAASVATLTVALAIAGSAQRLGIPSGFALMHPASSPGGRASQGYLGVTLRDIPDDQAPVLKLGVSPSQPRGVEIYSIDHDGPAGKAGLREHDVILQMNGQVIEGGEPLRKMLREMPPGRIVSFVISRAGQQQTVSAQMANREDVERVAWEQHMTVPDPQPPEPPQAPAPDHHGSGFFSSSSRASRNFLGGIVLSPGYTGAILETMAPQLAEYFGAEGRKGLLVSSVDSNSPAELAGMRAGDVVVRVNATSITASSDWLHAVRENKGKTIRVVVLRDRREQTLTMVPTPAITPACCRNAGGASGGTPPVSARSLSCHPGQQTLRPVPSP